MSSGGPKESDTPLLNCWEVKKCGREPGGRKVTETGVCPAATDSSAHGVNRGINGGRYCWKVAGTFCDSTPENDAAAKRIHCMMCEFYKKVEKEEGTSFKGVDEEHTEDLHKITLYLSSAFEEEKLVEVRLDDKVRSFFTRIMDHPPEPIPQTNEAGEPLLDENGEPVTITPFYQPGSYLHGRGHLLIQPLVPALGNVQIRSCSMVHLRFFEGIKAFEMELAFQRTLNVLGEPAIMLSFPHWVATSRKRAHFRVTIPEHIGVEILVEKKGFDPAPARMLDISPGGISYCHQEMDPAELAKEAEKTKSKPKNPPVFEKEDHLRVTITPRNMQGVTMTGFVRGKFQSNERVCRGRGRMVCGLQFDLPDRVTENKLLEVVSYYQRQLAQANMERRRVQQVKGEEKGEASSKHQAARELMDEKSKFSNSFKRILS